ncbi:MAG: hypothetical protein AUJ85_01185 [Elusimicrobia bacterium CG1_02_37_114]|nr:MAG: hypothetical protein AUJ85_01185 [Elusimicrobia bacterium CG1_02_37_114]PIV52658.1 MAG: ABC transporter ATP-binding protein [Elusimicrobia bacterium CG02_land_8_20_14_3_00_37_13]PIZ13684.1 MAG: ABC transporter ATP-binding protein [Elusimicrobia bacterium CG_4_10_14_0_8_um_filter_37_32]
MEYIIKTKSLSKTYTSGFWGRNKTLALQDITLSIQQGELFGVLGPNGAGKTTLLNIFSSQLIPDSGEVWILDKNVTRKFDNAVKNKINMISGNPNFPWSLTVEENLNFYAMLYNLNRTERKKIISECIDMFELNKFARTRYDNLSTGTKQKLALAKSLINSPELLLLDEPTIGLDPDISQKIRKMIKRFQEERKISIVLTTHYMLEAEELCDRIAFIKDGKILALGTSTELREITKTNTLEEAFIELTNK